MKLLVPHLLLSMNGAVRALENHAVAIDGDVIAAVGPASELQQRFPTAEIETLVDQVLMPGLINCHAHAAMNLLRGAADDLPLKEWLETRIWPLEGALADGEFVYDGTVIAAAEMLLGGITTFNDMYFYPEAAVEAALAVGSRIMAGVVVIEFPTRFAANPDEYIEKGLRARDSFKSESTVHWSVAPHAPYTVSDDTFVRLATLAEELNIPIHSHLHETEFEVSSAVAQHGERPFERLLRLGVISERFLAVHGVHLNEGELATMAKLGATLVHCPSSNMKLASGFAPTAKALELGVNVVVGTDGAASNNKLDLWEEARFASLLSKGYSGLATSWPAEAVLSSLTSNAAAALGLENHIGKIKAGLQADLISVNLSGEAHRLPLNNLAARLAYSGFSRDVNHVWVAGRKVVDSQQLTGESAHLVHETLRKVERVWQTRVGKGMSSNL